MKSRKFNYESDSDVESFKASAEVFSALKQMKTAVRILLSTCKVIKSEYSKMCDETKKVAFLTNSFMSLGIEAVQKLVGEANKLIKLFEEHGEILENFGLTDEDFENFNGQTSELDTLFNELWEETLTAPIRLLATSINNAKPEELDSVVKTHFGLFSAKKPAEGLMKPVTEPEKKAEKEDEKKNSM